MDVLQLIKAEHTNFRHQIASFRTSDRTQIESEALEAFLQALSHYISIETEFLYPEVSQAGQMPGARRLKSALEEKNLLIDLIAELLGALPQESTSSVWLERSAMLFAKVENYFNFLEEWLMPLLRSRISEENRADLGAHLLEVLGAHKFPQTGPDLNP